MELDYGEIEAVLEQITQEQSSFEALVQMMTEGRQMDVFTDWIKVSGEAALKLLNGQGRMVVTVCLLVISSAILCTIAKAFRNRQISDMGFYMIFLLLFLIMMKSFGTCYELTENVVSNLISFMKVLMPTYLMAVGLGAYRVSAMAYYEGFFLLIYYIQKMIRFVLLPAIRCYVLFSMLGYLGEEKFFFKGHEAIKKIVLWTLKAMLGIVAGVQMVQGMISPAVDEMKHTLLNKGISSLGSIGNVTQNVTEVIIGSGALLKNGIGAAAAVIIISLCLIPAVETSCYALFYQIVAAVSEPIADKRITTVVGQMGEGIGLLVKLLFTIAAMFLLMIAMICAATGGIR